MAQTGIDFALYTNTQLDEFGPQEIEKIGGQRGASLSFTRDTLNTSSKDASGWTDAIAAPFKSWSVEADGLYAIGEKGFEALESAFMSGEKISIELKTVGGTKYSGLVIITEMSLEMPHEDLVTYNVSMIGCGALLRGVDVVAP